MNTTTRACQTFDISDSLLESQEKMVKVLALKKKCHGHKAMAKSKTSIVFIHGLRRNQSYLIATELDANVYLQD